tara:strand:- start:636 stop:1955 length:1320 start_codon:yes stop_codon:yes gene_type:complete
MFKLFNILLKISILLSVKTSFALSSASYLITNSAINSYDYEKAYGQYEFSERSFSERDLYYQLLVLVNLNLLSDSVEVAKKIVKINPNHQEAWTIILTYARIKNDYKILNEYKKKFYDSEMELLKYTFFDEEGKIQTNPQIARSIFEIIKISISRQGINLDYKLPLFYLSIVNNLDKNFNEAYFLTAQIYQNLKKLSKAEKYFNYINAKHDLYIESQMNIAVIKSQQGHFVDGEKLLLNLIIDYPKNSQAQLAIADLYRFNQKYENAIKYYTNIINQDNIKDLEYWKIFYLRGICFERTNRWDLAEQDFLHSLKIEKDSADVLNYLAYGWLERDKNIDLALNMLSKAYEIKPESYYILDSLAWGYYKNNELNKAAELMEKVIEMAPGEAISLDHLADIYFAMQRKREAIFFWKQALDLAETKDNIIESLKIKLEKYNAG